MSEYQDVLLLQLHGKEITIVLTALGLLCEHAITCYQKGITDDDLACFTTKLEEVCQAQGWLT